MTINLVRFLPSLAEVPSPLSKTPPDILEWARQTFDEEEFLSQVREIEATGGLRLDDFIAELEARVGCK